ncbi:hypothetical protein KSP40_PGU015249 [Platanthera guangdongensis]|uniref:Acid phosphatase/vanadium-dependent haloperoxidase-related protein n=1 Tax=Platanthera guangdongensis TaxID=2320717 RepID=A0ABR2LGV2_9ASPA
MPSSHSASVSALAVAIGYREGFGSPVFACTMILAFVVRCLDHLFQQGMNATTFTSS